MWVFSESASFACVLWEWEGKNVREEVGEKWSAYGCLFRASLSILSSCCLVAMLSPSAVSLRVLSCDRAM